MIHSPIRSRRLFVGVVGAAALLATAIPALAGGADPWAVQAASAELTVYQFYCAPGLDVDLGPHPVVNSMQVAMASSSFRFEYGANCRDYYLGEIEPILTEFATGTDIAGAK